MKQLGVLLAIVLLSGCSLFMSKEQQALIKYINEDMQEASEHQEASATAFNNMLVDPNLSEEDIHDGIKDEALPEAEKALEVASNIEVLIDELEEPHALAVEAIGYYVDVLSNMMDFMEAQDPMILQEAEQAFTDYEETIEAYHSEIHTLAEAHDVEYEAHELDASDLALESGADHTGEDDSEPVGRKKQQEQQQEQAAGDEQLTEEQEAILKYINEDVAELSIYEEEAKVALDAVTGDNYTDNESVYETLSDAVVPLYKAFVKESQEMEAPIEALIETHNLLMEITEIGLESFEVRTEAYKKEDESLLEEADDLFDDYLNKLDDYHDLLSEVAIEFGLDYEPAMYD